MKHFVLIGLTVFWLASIALKAEENRTITVQGESSVSVEVTRTEMTIVVRTEQKTAKKAYDEIDSQTKQVITLLQPFKPARLEATGIRLHLAQKESKSILSENKTGQYRAENRIVVNLPTGAASHAIDKMAAKDTWYITSVEHLPNETAMSRAKEEALKQATLQARNNADTVLKALNLNRKEIQTITVIQSDIANSEKGQSNSVRIRVTLIITY